MLNSGKKILASCDKKKYSNSCVVRKKFLNETKYHTPPPPLQVKWSVPYDDHNMAEVEIGKIAFC